MKSSSVVSRWWRIRAHADILARDGTMTDVRARVCDEFTRAKPRRQRFLQQFEKTKNLDHTQENSQNNA